MARNNWAIIKDFLAFIADMCFMITSDIFFMFLISFHFFLFNHGSMFIFNLPFWVYVIMAIPPAYCLLWFVGSYVDMLILNRKAKHE